MSSVKRNCATVNPRSFALPAPALRCIHRSVCWSGSRRSAAEPCAKTVGHRGDAALVVLRSISKRWDRTTSIAKCSWERCGFFFAKRAPQSPNWRPSYACRARSLSAPAGSPTPPYKALQSARKSARVTKFRNMPLKTLKTGAIRATAAGWPLPASLSPAGRRASLRMAHKFRRNPLKTLKTGSRLARAPRAPRTSRTRGPPANSSVSH